MPQHKIIPPPMRLGDREWGFELTMAEAEAWHTKEAQRLVIGLDAHRHRLSAEANRVWRERNNEPPFAPTLLRRVQLWLHGYRI